MASSSQPSSSQPRPSQSLSQSTAPPSSQPQLRSKTKANTNNSKEKRAKINAPPRPGQEVISISDSRSGPISISDDAGPSRITITSDSDPRSIITISDSTSEKNYTTMPKVLPSAAKKTKSKGKAAPKASTKSASTSRSKPSVKPVVLLSPSISSAKTSIRRRSAVEEPMPRKRKHGIRDFDSSSEDGQDGDIYIPDPERMSASLSHAPVPLEREDLIPKSVLKPRDNTPSSADDPVKSPRASSSSSKRRRLSPPSPHLTPVKNEVPEQTQIPEVSLTPHDRRGHHDATQGASSGNEADEEEVPSSQSDEHELTIPKTVAQNPVEVKERVDHWRHMSGVSSVSESLAISPQSAHAGLPSEPEQPPPSSPAVVDVHTDAESPDIIQDELADADQFGMDDQDMMDIDFGMPEMAPPSYIPVVRDLESDDEAEVSQQIQIEASFNTSNTTVSSIPSHPPSRRPVTPPPLPDPSSSITVAGAGDSPLKSIDEPRTPLKPKTLSDSAFNKLSHSPFKPLPDAEFFRLSPSPKEEDEDEDDLPPAPAAPIDNHQRTQNVIARIKAEAAKRAAEMEVKSEEDMKADVSFDFDSNGESSSDDEELDFKYEYDQK